MQELDFKWFIDNMPNLYKEYGNCFLAIKNKQILGSYATYADAVHSTAQTEDLGTFIVQECGQDEKAYTNFIASADSILVTA